LILVTGATGLIGAHLITRLIEQGKEVVALKRPGSNLTNLTNVFKLYFSDPKPQLEKIRWVEGDITDVFSLIDAMHGVKEVYHCAGMVSFDKKNEKRLMKINVEGSANMINAALECGIEKFCHVSSVATLLSHDKKKNINETVPWKASPDNSFYAISKYGAEREAWRGMEEGLNVVIVNPAIVLGAACWGQSSSRLIDECYKGFKIYTEGITGYIDVRDVVKCMRVLMDNNKFGERFLLTSENLSFRNVFDLFHQQFDNPVPTIKAGKVLLEIGRLLDSIHCLLFSNERRLTRDIITAALDKTTLSNDKIKEEIDFEFIPIRDTITYVSLQYLLQLKENSK
jgi:dihydroflavonol-4-reductase